MVKTFKTSILILLFLAEIGDVKSQYRGEITKMHTFMQQNSDSTIIYKQESNWISPPTYLIISKKQDTISLYKYAPIFNKKINLPKKVRDTLYKINSNIDIFKVDINIFFSAKYIDEKSATLLWNSIKMEKPWQIKDDSKDGEACKEFTKDKYISDLGGISLFLITQNEIKSLYFYGPKYFEEKVCPSRIGRKAILAIEKQLLEAFKE